MVKFTFFDPDEEEQKPAKHEQPKPVVPQQAVRRGLTLDWVHELGWSENPFTLEARPSHEFIVNQEHARSSINLFFIKQHSFGTITGEQGMGKSFMLHWVKEELEHYKDRFTVYLFDASTSTDSFSRELTAQHSKVLSKYKGSTPEELATFLEKKQQKRLVILVDNADENEQLRPYLKQLVAQCGAAVLFAAGKPISFLKDELNVKLHALSSKDAVSMVEKRIAAVGGSNLEPFTEKFLEELWKASKHNPVQFLHFCNETAVKIALKQIIMPLEKTEAKKEKNEKTKKKPVSTYDDLIESLGK